MSKTPNKHYSAHKGHVYGIDVMKLPSGAFAGRIYSYLPSPSLVDLNSLMAIGPVDGDPRNAFLLANTQLNYIGKLGKCFLGKNPFERSMR